MCCGSPSDSPFATRFSRATRWTASAGLRRPAHTPEALTPVEVNAIRAAIVYWEAGRSTSGPKSDGQLGAIVEVMLGTSARIGEVLAIRRRDVDLTGAPPSIRIAGTIVSNVRYDRPDDYVTRRNAEIEALTPQQVAQAAQAIDVNALTWVVVGDLKQIEQPVRALNLGTLQVLDVDGRPVAAAAQTAVPAAPVPARSAPATTD